LPVADQLVKQADGLVHPVDAHQNQRKKPEQLQELRQKISVDPGQIRSFGVWAAACGLPILNAKSGGENWYLANCGAGV
jgi:hypothetical protein